MTENLCQKLLDEFKEATTEWVQASEATKAFVIMEPLSLNKDIELKSPEYYERMARAYEKEESARKNYFVKLHALQECEKKYKK